MLPIPLAHHSLRICDALSTVRFCFTYSWQVLDLTLLLPSMTSMTSAAVAAMAALLAEMEPIVAAAQEAATAEDSG